MEQLNLTAKLTFYVIISAIITSCSIKSEKADLIIHNALIYTVDQYFSKSEAIAIKDGKIIAIGKEREILNKYRYDEIYDAKTRPIYPGFIDAHCHFLGYGKSLQQVNLVGTSSLEEVIKKVVEFSKTNTSEWITGRGWDQNDWVIKEFPNNSALDSLFPNTPIFIRRIDGHAGLASSTALKLANITSSTRVEGGEVKLKNNKLTGVLIDNAMELINNVIPKTNTSTKIKALIDAQTNCFKVGLTTIDDAGLNKSDIELIDSLQKAGLLKMKIYAMLTDNEENFNHYLKTGPVKTERLNVRSFKFYADGALGSRGACLLHPYNDILERDHYGFLLHEPQYFIKYVKELYDAGFQMNTHCIGDSANRFMLNTYAEVLKDVNDKRWRIEHCQVMNESDFELFKNYSIIPSVQPTHATSDMYWAEERIGAERIPNSYAYKKLLNQLGFIALGTDFPIEGIDPLKTFYAAIARKDLNDFPQDGFQTENALSRKEALMGMTIWAALSNFEENEKGSLEVGKAADFVILEKDIMEVEEKELKDNKVVATFINGELVYEK
jgi:predicted amidohydrolase YtcJ